MLGFLRLTSDCSWMIHHPSAVFSLFFHTSDSMSLCSSQSAWPCSSSPETLDARGLGWCITWHRGETWGLIENKTGISPKDLKNQSKIPCWGHSFIFGRGIWIWHNLTILWQKGLNPCSQIQPRQLERDGMTLFILQSSNMAGCNIHLFW